MIRGQLKGASDRPRRKWLSKLAIAATIIGSAMALAAAGYAKAAGSSAAALPRGFQSRDAEVGPVRIHYVIGGQGPAVLLIHGWPETWYEWRGTMKRLARSHTVIAADMRGFGESSLSPSGYDKKTLAQDLYGLMQQLGHPHAIVVGHDWGGPVAYAYAAQHPDAVTKLVLIEGAPFGPWMKSIEPFWFFHFFRVPGGYAEKLIEGRVPQFLSYFYRSPEFHVVPAFDDQVIATYTAAYARPGRMVPGYALYRAIDQDVRDNVRFAKEKLSIPVLAIGARRGAGEATDDGARAVATNVTPILFEDTGHFIPEERPAALAKIIEDFAQGRPIASVWRPS